MSIAMCHASLLGMRERERKWERERKRERERERASEIERDN